MITTPPPTVRLFNQITTKSSPQKTPLTITAAVVWPACCHEGQQSLPDFSNFPFENWRRKFQQPEERQIVTAAAESFQRNNGAGPAFTYPNSSKQSKVMKDQSGFLHQDNCWQLSELACAVSVYHFYFLFFDKHANLKCF